MPLPITFDWSEDDIMLSFVLHVRGVKAKNVDVALCDVYVKVNCHPAFFEADLLHEIDPEHPATRCRVGTDKLTLSLRKRTPGLWHEFRAVGSKAELRARRQQALAVSQERETNRLKRRGEWKEEMIKAGEHEQWRLDRENREQVEKWEQQEKEKWEEDVYAAFDEETKVAVEPAQLPVLEGDGIQSPSKQQAVRQASQQLAQPLAPAVPGAVDTAGPPSPSICEVTDEEAEKIRAGKPPAPSAGAGHAASGGDGHAIWSDRELDDTEEYVPSVRENPGKVGLRFTERPRPGVPVRDRGPRPPPHPRDAVKNDHAPPMLAGDDRADESDPVWLKDKADSLMVAGDYQGAYNAYTEALKIAINAKAFANRAVADLYLGNTEQCLEDCNHCIKILDHRQRTKDGHMPGPADPQDQVLRAKVEVRMGMAYLWLGAFTKADMHFCKALETEDGLDPEEKNVVKEDLARIQQAKAALPVKERADGAARGAPGGRGDSMSGALELYAEAAAVDSESAVIHANRCFARLRAGQLQECLADSEAALQCLRMWPTARRPPATPSRPSRLDPPYIDDPTFKHPDQQKQGEVDWLMKHSGGSTKDLPTLPSEYEWIKDAAEKSDNAWIAVRRKMPQATIDTIRKATRELQDVLYLRKPYAVREQVRVAIEQNKAGEGPSAKAIRQAEEYADRLEEHEKEKRLEREKQEDALRQEHEETVLEEVLAHTRSGVAQTGFGHSHPVERTRRRLFVKVLLRRAAAFEQLGDVQAGMRELHAALQVEPENREARQRLMVLEEPPAVPPLQGGPAAASAPPLPATAAPQAAPPAAAPAPAVPAPTAVATVTGTPVTTTATSAATAIAKDERVSSTDCVVEKDGDADSEDDAGPDHASTAALLNSAAEYMRRDDYTSALQIYNYARNRCKVWESPTLELKVLSNTSLCLQRIRGRLPELISVCNEAISRITELRERGGGGVSEELLLHMECACLSRRGSAYAQQKKMEDSNRDAAHVRQLLARVGEMEASHQPAPAG